MDKASIIGRVLLQADSAKAESILSQFRPMLTHPKYVDRIFNAVYDAFSEESEENKRLIFVATCYQLYQPLSFLDQAAGKLPAGVRDEISKCLGYVNSEMANYLKTFTEPFMRPFNTGPERPFRLKVMQIVERFKAFSINASDSQYQLSL